MIINKKIDKEERKHRQPAPLPIMEQCKVCEDFYDAHELNSDGLCSDCDDDDIWDIPY